MIKLDKIRSISELINRAKWLQGKTLWEISKEIEKTDKIARAITKGDVGYIVENGFFGIKKNSGGRPDVEHLGVEIKTCPLKYNKARTRLSVKEPLSLNMINYVEEAKHTSLSESSMYKKNRRVLFIFYIHDKDKERSKYEIKYVFLWEMTSSVINELEPDYDKIIEKINAGKAEDIHQGQHVYLTLCPKHNGDYSDPNEMTSKAKQPYSKVWAERRAFRLKTKYMNLILSRYLHKELKLGGWEI